MTLGDPLHLDKRPRLTVGPFLQRGRRRGLSIKKAPISGGFVERMMGLEPTTFSMARRRSSQLSYIRERAQYSRAQAGLGCVERLVHELVGQLVVLAAHGGVVDLAKPAGQAARASP